MNGSIVASKATDPRRRAGAHLVLTPRGHLLLREAAGQPPSLEPEVAARIHAAFLRGAGPGLFHLGAVEVATPLAGALSYWRDFGKSFITRLCGTPDLEGRKTSIELPLPPDAIDGLLAAAPPMEGGEYLGSAALSRLWAELHEAFRAAVRAFKGTVQELLASLNPAWHVV